MGEERPAERRVPGPHGFGAPQRSAAVARAGAVLSGSAVPIGRLVRVLAMAVEVPVGLASLVADQTRQTVAGCHGLPDMPAGYTGPVRYGLCLHVTRTGLPIIVTDAGTDVRIRERLGVHDDEVSAYVGYPLRGPDGHTVGALCVVDHAPRQWSGRELALVDHTAQLINAVLAETGAERRPVDSGGAFLGALLDSLDTGVAACDADGRLVVYNRSLRRYAVREPRGTRPEQWEENFAVCLPDGAPAAPSGLPMYRALRGEQVHGVELLIGPPERRRHVLVNGHPIVDADGRRLGAVCAVHDITERRRVQRLQACETAVSYALAAAPDIASAGRALLDTVGTGLGFVHGELWLPEPAGQWLTCAASWTTPCDGVEARMPQRVWRGEGLAGTAWERGAPVWQPEAGGADRFPSGGTRVRAALALPVSTGAEIGGVLTFFAGTEHEPDDPVMGLLSGVAAHLGRYLEHRRAEELALALARTKDEYVALVGHELRTPLTSISTFAGLMLDSADGTDAAELRPLIEAVDRNATQLRAIVDDLLELAALDSGEAPFGEQPVDLAALVEDAVARIAAAAARQRLDIAVDTPAALLVTGDPVRLRQVLDNLLDNAVTFSPGGGRLSVAARPDGELAVVTITDPGIGIPEGEHEMVFRRFHHSSRTAHRGLPGTGLGLPLSRAIAERHRGTLRLVAAESGGTTAILALPLRPGGEDRPALSGRGDR